MQPFTAQFHRSVYITLGLACLCLGYAELAFLPQITGLAVAVVILLIVAYFVEGKWSLSIPAANALGGVIAIAAIAWMAFQILGPEDSIVATLPWPTSLLPYLGPLLMILIPAKSFRPKHNGDYWGLQGIGLIAVALGCALTGDPIFGALMLAYLISCVWSLTLFFIYREQQRIGVITLSALPSTRPRRRFLRASTWGIGIVGLALALFLLTPRATDAKWEFHSVGGRMQTGLDEMRPGIDLNRSGTLSENRDRVFTARAYTIERGARILKTDLDAGQRWRHMPFNSYEFGRWDNRAFADNTNRSAMLSRRFMEAASVSVERTPAPPPPTPTMEVQQPHFFIDFSTQIRGAARQIKAEPIWLVQNGELIPSVATRIDGETSYRWMRSVEGEMSPPAWTYQTPQADYVQTVPSSGPPGVSPLLPMQEANLEHLRNCNSVPRLRAWARNVLRTMVAQGRLPEAVLSSNGNDVRVPPQYYEAVGRAFEGYLSTWGGFHYSTKLTREDPKVDPVEDFVLNSRTGHCNRFSSALALMLRAVGIPSRVVLGYRGFETEGDGSYDVLQCHAHSWVEMAFRLPTDGQNIPFWQWAREADKWRWLTLDPTPNSEELESSEMSWSQWWNITRHGFAVFFKSFVVEYDQDQQNRARNAFYYGHWGILPKPISRLLFGNNGDDWLRAGLIGLGVLALVLLIRWVIRRRRNRPAEDARPDVSFYQRMLTICRQTLGMCPRIGQTPGEFAAATGAVLRDHPSTRELAEMPAETAALYYRVRFGDRPLKTEELTTLDESLGQLKVALYASKRDR